MRKGRTPTLLVVVLVLLAPASQAFEPDVALSGYGTVGLACFSADTAQFAINNQTRGPGAGERCDAGLDSLLAAQLDARIQPTLDLIVQATLLREPDGRWRPELRHAQFAWHLSDATTIRLGRSSNPNFLYSETRDLRYAMPWNRPPFEVYGLSLNKQFDGVDLLRRWDLPAGPVELHAGVSRSGLEGSLDGGTVDPVRFRQAFLALNMQFDQLRLKASYTRADLVFRPTALVDLFSAIATLGPDGAALAAELDVDRTPFRVGALGARWSHRDWTLYAEWARRSRIGFLRGGTGGYLSVERRFGAWSVAATGAARRSDGPLQDARAGPLAPILADVLALTRYDNDSIGLTLARDLGTGHRLKLQWERIAPKANSFGPYVGHTSGYDLASPGGERLLSLNIDFVF